MANPAFKDNTPPTAARSGSRGAGRPRRSSGELVKVSLLLDPDIPEQRAVLDCIAKLPRARRQDWLRQSVIFGTIERGRALGDIMAPLEFNRSSDADTRDDLPAWAFRVGIISPTTMSAAEIIAGMSIRNHGSSEVTGVRPGAWLQQYFQPLPHLAPTALQASQSTVKPAPLPAEEVRSPCTPAVGCVSAFDNKE
jgi:hypothetical protein